MPETVRMNVRDSIEQIKKNFPHSLLWQHFCMQQRLERASAKLCDNAVLVKLLVGPGKVVGQAVGMRMRLKKADLFHLVLRFAISLSIENLHSIAQAVGAVRCVVHCAVAS